MMLKIGLSQRLDFYGPYREIHESLDQRWSQLLCKERYIPIPLSSIVLLKDLTGAINFDGFLLTGGPSYGSPHTETRDRFEYDILSQAAERNIPVLGVCRGFQMMNRFLGGTLQERPEHVGKTHEISVFGDFCMTVNSFHTRCVDCLGKGFESFAICNLDQSIEGAFHQTLPWIGIMWHMERDDPFQDFSSMLLYQLFHQRSTKGLRDACHRFSKCQ